MPYYPPAGTGGGAAVLDDLTDVIITAPSNTQVLKYNGSNWINDTDATGGAGSVAQVAATIGPITYGVQHAEATVVDANITATSKIIISWGNITDADENTPDMDTVIFNAVPAAGSMAVQLSAAAPLDRLGGTYKINYLIG